MEGIEKSILEKYIKEGYTIKKISQTIGFTVSQIKHFMKKNENTGIDLRIITNLKEIKSIDFFQIESMNRVIDLYNLEDIDYSKFVKRH